MKCTGTEKKPENPPLIRRRRRSNPNHISKDLKDWIGLLDWIGLDCYHSLSSRSTFSQLSLPHFCQFDRNEILPDLLRLPTQLDARIAKQGHNSNLFARTQCVSRGSGGVGCGVYFIILHNLQCNDL